MATKLERLFDLAETHADWEKGPLCAWQCNAVVGSSFLKRLVFLASKAPKEAVDRFVQDFSKES